MNKEAWSPAEILLMTALTGGGAFGGMRMLSDAFNKVVPEKPKENVVSLNLPEEHPELPFSSPKTAAFGDPISTADPSPWSNKLMAGMIGLPGGFLGAKYLYDKYKEKEMNSKIDQAKQQYITQLQLAKATNKIASETPCVDSMCEAIAEELSKEAEISAADIAMASKNPDIQHMVANHYDNAMFSGGGKVINTLGLGMPDLTKQTAKVVMGGGLIGTLGALLYANQKKKEKEQGAQYPMKVVYGQ
ncbi:hypothetical protein CCP3SC5AM1_880013 [Gammaproteobacteria bacterium]